MCGWEKPEGWMTSGDIAQACSLRGQQVYWLLQDHGTNIDGRMCIKRELFEALKHDGTLANYTGYSIWRDEVRGKKLRRPYTRRVGNKIIHSCMDRDGRQING